MASRRVRAFTMTIQGNAKRFRCVEDVRRVRVALWRAVLGTQPGRRGRGASGVQKSGALHRPTPDLGTLRRRQRPALSLYPRQPRDDSTPRRDCTPSPRSSGCCRSDHRGTRAGCCRAFNAAAGTGGSFRSCKERPCADAGTCHSRAGRPTPLCHRFRLHVGCKDGRDGACI